jgi:tetratricopeptide (TPR) repeat protein
MVPPGEPSDFGAGLAALYGDFARRVNIDEWEGFLLSFDTVDRERHAAELVDFLNAHHVLPVGVWQYIDDICQVAINREFKWRHFMSDFPDIVGAVTDLVASGALDASLAAEYAELRLEAYLSRGRKGWKTAARLAHRAIKLCRQDWLVYDILADCEVAAGNWAAAEEAVNRARELQPDPPDPDPHLARIWMETARYDKAAKEYARLGSQRLDVATILARRAELQDYEDRWVECRRLGGHTPKFWYARHKKVLAEERIRTYSSGPNGTYPLGMTPISPRRWRRTQENIVLAAVLGVPAFILVILVVGAIFSALGM